MLAAFVEKGGKEEWDDELARRKKDAKGSGGFFAKQKESKREKNLNDLKSGS